MGYYLRADYTSTTDTLTVYQVDTETATNRPLVQLIFDCDTTIESFATEEFVAVSVIYDEGVNRGGKKRTWSFDSNSTEIYVDGVLGSYVGLAGLEAWFTSRRGDACGAIANSSSGVSGNATSILGDPILTAPVPALGNVLEYDGANWVPTAPTAASANATQIQGTAVAAAAPTNGDLMAFDGTNWLPVDQSTLSANAASLQGNAIQTGAPTAGQHLEFDGTTWNYVAVPSNATTIQGVAVGAAAPAAGQIYQYNGTQWAPVAVPEAATLGGQTMPGGTPLVNQVLQYDGTNWAYTTPTNSDAATIQGSTVSGTAPTANQIWVFTGGAWTPAAATSVEGNAAQIKGIAVETGTPISGEALVYNGTEWAYSTPAANATQLQGQGLSATVPTVNQVLQFDGTNWVPTAGTNVEADAVQIGGIAITGTPANGEQLQYNGTNWVYTTPSSDATAIQGTAVSAVAPTTGQVFQYNGTNWAAVDSDSFEGDAGSIKGVAVNATAPTSGQVLAYDGTEYVATTLTIPTAASAISGAATDATGAIGTGTDYARVDHVHPAQGISADANNILTLGSDGLHELTLDASGFSGNLATTDDTLQEIADKFDAYQGSARIFAGNTTVAPASAGSPTLAEIVTFVGTNRDAVVYYTASDTSTDTPTHVYHVDSAGAVTQLLSPAASGANATQIQGTAVAVTAPATGQVLAFNGTSYTPATLVQPSSTISPASTDATGAVGTGTTYAKDDHAHPAQGVSADAGNIITAGTDGLHLLTDTAVDHDATTNFVANEHIDHTSVSVTAGTGLTGGGDISTTKTINVDVATGADVAAGTAAKMLDASSVIDEDTMVSDSNQAVPTQQSVKAYVDSSVSGIPTAANAIPLAADDATGAIGANNTEFALEDHKHPAQGVSADANNILTVGTDGLHQLPLDATGFSGNLATTDDTLQEIADKFDAFSGGGANRTFLDDTTVAPATAGQPTVAEITTAFAAAGTNQLLYYTGTDISTDAESYVYWVDNAGVVTQIEETGVEIDLTGIATGEQIIWDGAKFVRTPTLTNDTAAADIILTSTGIPNYYGVGADRTEATLNIDDTAITRGAKARIKSATGAAFPSFTSTSGNVTFEVFGDTSAYDAASANIIDIEVVDSTPAAPVVWVTFPAAGSTSVVVGAGLTVPWIEEIGFPNSQSYTGVTTSSVLANGTLDLYGGGLDVAGAGDQAIFWYSPDFVQLNTTYEIVGATATEVITGTFNNGAGPYLAIRTDATDEQAKMVVVGTNPGNTRFQQKRRTSQGGGVSETNDSPGGSYDTNFGLRQVVDGSGNIDSFYSQDGGTTWTQVGITYTDLTAEITAGTARFGFIMDSHESDLTKITRIQGTFQII